MTQRARLAVIAAAVVAAVAGFVIARSGDDDGSKPAAKPSQPKPAKPKPTIPEVEVRDGKPVGGVQKITVKRGERVRFTVTSDAADEVHVHGYDRTEEVPAGGTASFDFEADADGIFEVELHDLGEQIASLTVEP